MAMNKAYTYYTHHIPLVKYPGRRDSDTKKVKHQHKYFN